MASEAKINQFDYLSSFIHKRFTAIAGEIFQVLRDILVAFQEEIDRSKQENVYLKKMLSDVSNAGLDATNKQTDGSPLEHQDSNQGPLDSDTDTSVIQVKLCSVQQEPEIQQQLCTASTRDSVLATADQRPPHIFIDTTGDSEGNDDIKMCMESYATVKLERCDALICIDKSQLSEIQNGSGGDHLGVRKDEYSLQPPSHSNNSSDVSHPAFNLENLTTEVVIYCEICGKYFKNNKLLKNHVIRYHKKKSHHCELCGKCFTFPCILRRHLRTHTGEKRHHCKFCGKIFGHRSNVKEHERMHNDERPYCCSVCGKRFFRINHLRLHIQNCHKKTSPAKTHGKSKKTTQNTQGAYCCNVCGKSFGAKYTFNVHYRIHTGEKPYHCRFCNKAFRQKSHVVCHESTHTGQKI